MGESKGSLTVFVSFQGCPGLEQYAVKKFAQSLETIPRALAENAGFKVCYGEEEDVGVFECTCVHVLQANEVVSKLYAAHQRGEKNTGIDVEVMCLVFSSSSPPPSPPSPPPPLSPLPLLPRVREGRV